MHACLNHDFDFNHCENSMELSKLILGILSKSKDLQAFCQKHLALFQERCFAHCHWHDGRSRRHKSASKPIFTHVTFDVARENLGSDPGKSNPEHPF